MASSSPPIPILIRHKPDDHRYVDPSEILKLPWYDTIMNPRGLSTINDFVVNDASSFLCSTSKWDEKHLAAFRCLLLDNLPRNRILPDSIIPDDQDQTMKLVKIHLMATETEVRNFGVTLQDGPATLFYSSLSNVLRRPPSPPSPIPIQRTLHRPLFNTTSAITEPRSESETDSSYRPSPPRIRETSPMDVVQEQSGSQRSSIGSIASSIPSDGEDKLELISQQTATTLMTLLTMWESRITVSHGWKIDFSVQSLIPSLLIVGKRISSYNDGSFFLTGRSTRRHNEWVIRDLYPRASLECKRKKSARPNLVLAQELGELMAIAHNRYYHGIWTENDREVFLIGFHHDRLHMTAVEFPEDYFKWVAEVGIIPRGLCLVLRRSQSYDMSKPDSRIEGCRLVLGMLRRIMPPFQQE